MQEKTRMFVEAFKALSPIAEVLALDIHDGISESEVIRRSRDMAKTVSDFSKEMDGVSPSSEVIACMSKIVAAGGTGKVVLQSLRTMVSELSAVSEKIVINEEVGEIGALGEVLSDIVAFYVGSFDFFRDLESDIPVFSKMVISASESGMAKLSVPKSKKDFTPVSTSMILVSGKILLSLLRGDARRFVSEAEKMDESSLSVKAKTVFGSEWLTSLSERLNKMTVMIASASSSIVPRGKAK